MGELIAHIANPLSCTMLMSVANVDQLNKSACNHSLQSTSSRFQPIAITNKI